MALISFIVPIMPTIFPGVPASPTISFVVVVVSPALVVLTLIFVEEMIRERSLISHILHFSLCDVALAIVSGPVAWNGLLLVLATRAGALVSALTRVVHRPDHVNAERETWLAPPKVSALHHVNGGARVRVHFHGRLAGE
jgi:hypothetical protein